MINLPRPRFIWWVMTRCPVKGCTQKGFFWHAPLTRVICSSCRKREAYPLSKKTRGERREEQEVQETVNVVALEQKLFEERAPWWKRMFQRRVHG